MSQEVQAVEGGALGSGAAQAYNDHVEKKQIDWQALQNAHTGIPTSGQSEDERRAREMARGMNQAHQPQP